MLKSVVKMEALYMQIVNQTDKEKLAMYMKCKKKELAEMLIECNKHLELHMPKIEPNYKKLRKEFTKILNSYTKEELADWIKQDELKDKYELIANS